MGKRGHWECFSWALLSCLLGLSIATLSTVTCYGLHFSIISNAALESSSYRAIHHTGTARLWRTQCLGREGTLEVKTINPVGHPNPTATQPHRIGHHHL
uniref:Secreted protein n=1 Tax=Gallus gallus TaxID=9031 RepID=A0A8V1A2F0_CHICK